MNIDTNKCPNCEIQYNLKTVTDKRRCAGAIGGRAKVAKGFAMMSPERLREVSAKNGRK